MWLKKGTGVAIRRCPDPSRVNASWMSVSLVLRWTLALRFMRKSAILSHDPQGISGVQRYTGRSHAMSQRARSPVLGYNHNIRHGGRVFHVQTEDSGTGYARLYTHLFFEGTILSSKKAE